MLKKQTGRPGEKSDVQERSEMRLIVQTGVTVHAFGQSFLEGIHSIVDMKSDL